MQSFDRSPVPSGAGAFQAGRVLESHFLLDALAPTCAAAQVKFRIPLGSPLGVAKLGAKLGANWGQSVPNTGKNRLIASMYVVEKTGASTVIASGKLTRRSHIVASFFRAAKISAVVLKLYVRPLMPRVRRRLTSSAIITPMMTQAAR
jgi:hypothetical protein